MPRGLRNHNPLNIRLGGDTFQGEIIGSADPAFKQFQTMGYGYRAAIVTIATYIQKGFNTVEKIIGRWAPPEENDTAKYIKTVCSKAKVKRDKELTLNDGAEIIEIVGAMSFVENGVPAEMSAVEEGFKLQTRIKRG
jgi:hypothetical protein